MYYVFLVPFTLGFKVFIQVSYGSAAPGSPICVLSRRRVRMLGFGVYRLGQNGLRALVLLGL